MIPKYEAPNDVLIPASEGLVTAHPAFSQPADANTLVWRYLDLAGLSDLLSRKRLRFARVDTFPDNFEGSYPKRHYEQLDPNCWVVSFSPNFSIRGSDKLALAEQHQMVRYATYASCWRLGNEESDSMWRLYCPSDSGAAITLPYCQLARSANYYTYYMGCIRYIDYETEIFPDFNYGFHAHMHKRREYADEHEVRIIHVPEYRFGPDAGTRIGPHDFERHTYLTWHPELWIQSIVASPYAAPEFMTKLKELIKIHMPSLEPRIRASSLTRDPFY